MAQAPAAKTSEPKLGNVADDFSKNAAAGKPTDGERNALNGVPAGKGVPDARTMEVMRLLKSAESHGTEMQHDLANLEREQALTLTEEILGKDCREASVQRANWAQELLTQGKSDRAESLLRHALVAELKLDGEESENVLRIKRGLVNACVKQGKQEEALVLQAGLISSSEKRYGATSRETARIMSDASFTFNEAGKSVDGEGYAKKSVALFETLKLTGTEDYATALNNLGSSLLGQKRYSEAEAEFRKSYDLLVKLYGEDSPALRSIVNNLAVAIDSVAEIQGDTKRREQAEAMYRRSLVITEKQFGPRHPQVAVRLGNIANVLMNRGKLKEAESLLRKAVEIEDETLPKADTQRITTRMKLVGAIRLLGRVTEAEQYCQKTLADAEAMYGPEHASVAEVLHALGGLLAGLNRAIEAEQSFWRAMKIREKALGMENVEVARSLNNVALLVQARGDYKNPESMFRRVIAINEKHYGKGDIMVAQDIVNLASNLKLQKRWAEAETQIRRAMAIYEKTFGKDHHMMGGALQDLASILMEEKRYEQAEAVLREALAVHQKSLGDNHPRTADTMLSLAMVLHKRERLVEAEHITRDALLIFAGQSGASKLPAQMMGNISDFYQRILYDLHVPRNMIFDRVEALLGGTDPGPLPGSST